MFTCEYDYTSPSSKEYISNYARKLYPKHTEIDEQVFMENFSLFWRQPQEWIKLNGNYRDTDNGIEFTHYGRTFFSIVLHPGLNGETWYHGVTPATAETMAVIKPKITIIKP